MGLLILFFIVSLPVFLFSPGPTWQELNSFIVGEKINQGLRPYVELIDSTPLLTQWMYGAFNWISGQNITLRHSLALLILFFQAGYIGLVFINRKAYTETTYIPSVLFCLLCCVSFDVISITGTLLASGFLLLAVNSIFREIEFREPNDSSLVKSGVYLGLASLAVFSYVIFFFAAILILAFFTRSSLRRQFLFVIGFSLPHALLLSYYYLLDQQSDLLNYFYKANLFADERVFQNTKTLLILSSVPIAYFAISFFSLNRATRLTNYQSQLLQAMFIWLLAGVVHLFFTRSLRPQSLLPLFPPLSFLLTHFLLSINRKRFAEIHIWVFTIGILLTSYLVRNNFFFEAGYSGMIVKESSPTLVDKRILILGDDYSPYMKNQLATGFSEWAIYKKVFEEPDYYENILIVNNQFALEKPEVIIDPNNLFAAFFRHLPELEKQYHKKGNVYYINEVNGAN
ncbi:hypothetical protein SanaruYs_13710 [Chryseotalea sanaruensis]|uniref:Glycosyltransferase RgtA/B/C/D-like domain-containing protein n=1 Tax=Chryseotalea sanaruensis TaxID=2482724 RepID=A0A401U8B6_9BACT|nr:hypothetical protein SanaruYs_13710 [Chryseotalea sanaruensis]